MLTLIVIVILVLVFPRLFFGVIGIVLGFIALVFKAVFGSDETKFRPNFEYKEAEYLVKLLAKVAKADGRVSELEAMLISEILDDLSSKLGGLRDNLKLAYNNAKNRTDDAYDIALDYKMELNLDPKRCVSIVFVLLNLAYIDGKFDGSERKIISDIAFGFGIDDEILEKIIRKFEEDHNKFNYQKNESKSQKSPYEILGLKENENFENVKKRYKELVKKYHPDILRGRGESDETILESTRKLQEINEAYERIKRGEV